MPDEYRSIIYLASFLGRILTPTNGVIYKMGVTFSQNEIYSLEHRLNQTMRRQLIPELGMSSRMRLDPRIAFTFLI